MKFVPSLKHLSDGFTLIETLVVTTIMVLMLGGALVAFANFRDRREVQTEAMEVAERLRKVQAKASAAEVPSGCSAIENYEVNLAGSDFAVEVNCGSGTVGLSELDYTLVKGSFDSDQTIFFDSRAVTATAVDIDICGNGALFRIGVSAVGFVGRPSYVGSC